MYGAGTLDLHHHLLDLAEAMRPLPATVSRLAAVIADESSQIEDVSSIIREDPSLIAALLRESNSAASAPASEIVTVEAAVMRLGLARVLAIATSSSLGSETQKPLPAYDLGAGDLWTHSVTCSYAAEAVYRMSSRAVGPEVVTAALLHDIGQIVLDNVLDRDQFVMAKAVNVLVTTAERELVEVDHAELGALLLELWEIPRTITNAVRFHHDPEAAIGELPAHAVYVANLVAHEIAVDDDEIDDDFVEELHEEEQAQLERSLDLLDVDHEDLVERAIRLLVRAGLREDD
jgi:HD-like signal output (HDOD) protein